MQYDVIVAGPRGSGKSCLIASAIVHARRLAVLDLKPAPRQHRSAASAGSELVMTASGGVDIWSVQECSHFDTPAQVDALARRLWDRWLVRDLPPQPAPPESTPLLPFAVTSIASKLVGLEEFIGNAPRINLIEASNDLFYTFDRSAAASRSMASQRLQHLMQGANALVVCLSCADNWTAATRRGTRNIVNAWHEIRGTEVVIALTQSDLVLAERSLVSQAAINPVEPIASESAEAAVGADPTNLAFLKSLQLSFGITLQACSSYGVLRLSNTPNVDLVKSEPTRGRAAAPPLWPVQSPHLSEIMPSAPSTLKYWMPLGAVESLFGVTPQLAPV